MQRAYFVSDLHLTDAEQPRARLFSSFLDSLSGGGKASHLFLLGDIFDLWVADHRYFVDKYRLIVEQLIALRDEGVEIHFFEGNHDLHLAPYWAARLGVTVHGGPSYVTIAGRVVRLEHGDQMDPDDRGYRFLRWFLRTPPVRFLARRSPGAVIAGIGERASSASRKYNSRANAIAEAEAVAIIRSHALRAYRQRPFDVIVSGHVHVRDDCELEEGVNRFRSINLGTWLEAPCCLRIDASGVELVELWPADAGGGADPVDRVERAL